MQRRLNRLWYVLFGLTLCLVCAPHALAERITIVANVANIRSGPGTEHDILWNVEKYHPLQVLETKGNWYRFRDFEGDEGWIHKSLTGKVQAVITAKDKCNIRSGPGTKFEILFTVEKGIPFKVISTKGAWLNIEHADGDKGWLHKSLVW